MNSLDELYAESFRAGRENWSPENLRAYQLERLNRSYDLARKHSRFYNVRLAKAVFTDFSNWERVPFTTQEDLRRHPIEHFLCTHADDISRVVSLRTSGSTGKAKRIAFTQAELDDIAAFFEYGMRQLGEKGKKILVCMPGCRENGVSALLMKACVNLGMEAEYLGVAHDIDETVRKILDYKPQCIAGLPAQMHCAAQVMKHHQLRAPGLETVLLSADHLPDVVRGGIEEAMGCAVFNHYGTTEMGFGAALECAHHNGMHLREGELYFEIIDPSSGRVLPPGRPGELVFTTLRRKGMPLIRYKTGDHTRFMPQACGCGSILRKIAPPVRPNDITVHEARLSQRELDEACFAMDGLLDYSAGVNEQNKLQLTLWCLNRERFDTEALRLRLGKLPGLDADGITLAYADTDAVPPGILGKRVPFAQSVLCIQ